MSFTSSTYRQYKHGTEAMFKWLERSLDDLGITFGGKLEDASIRSLLNLASRAQQKGASMPFEILYALEDALKIRRQYNAWYSRQLCQRRCNEDNKHIEQSNEAHAAFIDVLQEIHNLFAPVNAPPGQPPSPPPSVKILEISNLFTNLEVEDATAEKPHAAVATPSAGAEQADKPWMAKKSQMLVEDKLLELYCLFDDANKIRGYLRKKWDEYAARKLDIISAAMITQEALELFSEAENSFESKYGTIPEYQPDCFHPKHLDIVYHLAIGEPMTSTYTTEVYSSMSAAEIAAAKLKAEKRIENRQLRILKSDWKPSGELVHWLMRPAICVLEKMLSNTINRGGTAWVLQQACRTPADRDDALSALGFDEDLECFPRAAAQELLITFIGVYAGMIFMQQNPGLFIGSPDIITSQWLRGNDWSIRMVLSMQILHEIRTAKSESGQLDLLTQVSEDYKRLVGLDMAVFDETFDHKERTPLLNHHKLRSAADAERCWLQGRAPGRILQPGNISKAKSQKLSELPLAMNPVLVGMVLLELYSHTYRQQMSFVNNRWFLIPCAHLLNWVAVKARGEKAAFQELWPDMHTALGLIGPKPIWLGSSPPETLGNCQSRILLAWGLQLNDFYQRIISGDIPKAEELFRKIKDNCNERARPTDERLLSLINSDVPASSLIAEWESTHRRSHPLKIEISQSTPLMDAVHRNLESSDLMKAQQNHIRKILLGSGRKRKSGEELDMMSYLDAFSRTIRAEMPRMIFPYKDLSHQCAGLSVTLFRRNSDRFDLPQEILKCATFAEFKNLKPIVNLGKLGSGAQSVSSLLALATIFGDRIGRQPVERLMLDYIEKDWDEEPIIPLRDHFTKTFVEKCLQFGFAIPECATAALS